MALALLLGGCGHPAARVLLAADEPQPPLGAQPAVRVALVLSSGGLRGLAHLGVLRALEAHGLRPDMVVGTSVGAIVGAAYAAGTSGQALSAQPMPQTLDPWSNWFVSPSQRSQALEAFVATAVNGRRIEQLPHRFIAVATERRDGCIALFGRGDVARAVAASSALPGALAPVQILGQTFSDGGLAAPLPVRVARALGAQRVIAVDTTFHAEAVVPDTVFDSVFHAGMVMARNLALADRLDADVLIEPRLPPVAEVLLSNREALIAAGERATLAQLPRLRQLFAAAAASGATAPQPLPAAALPMCERAQEVAGRRQAAVALPPQ